MTSNRRRPVRRSRPPAPVLAPSVLIADDDPDQRYIYAAYFLSCGFRVRTAPDGEIAVLRAVESVPDVVIMDLSMPRVDGWEATRRLRSDARTAHVPIVACTAHAFGPPVERALAAGCDAYVVKPCEPPELLREVERLLARRVDRRRRA